jgi:hypothetical protein
MVLQPLGHANVREASSASAAKHEANPGALLRSFARDCCRADSRDREQQKEQAS